MRWIWAIFTGSGYLSAAYNAWIGLGNYDLVWRWIITAMLIIAGLEMLLEKLGSIVNESKPD